MKLFLNSCIVEEIAEARTWGILDGVTMNPSMVAAINTDYVATVESICKLVDVPVFVQSVASRADRIVDEGRRIASIDDKIVVKVHSNTEGVKAMSRLKAAGIAVCATAMHSVMEAIVVERANVDYVVLFLAALRSGDERPTFPFVSDVRRVFDRNNSETQVIVAARTKNEIIESARADADCITCDFSVWETFLTNHHTQARWEKFICDWKATFGEKDWITGN